MADYTDVRFYLEKSYEELKKAKELFKKIDLVECRPNTIEKATMVNLDFEEIEKRLNNIWEKIDDISDDFEESLKSGLNQRYGGKLYGKIS